MRVWAAPFQGAGKNPSVVIAVEVQVPLKDLAPGRYVVRVEAASKLGKHTTYREVPIEVRAAAPRPTM